MSNSTDNHPVRSPVRAGWNHLDSRLAIWVLTWALFATCIVFAGCVQESAAVDQASSPGSPALAGQQTIDIHTSITPVMQQDPPGVANNTPPTRSGEQRQVQPSGTPPDGGGMAPGGQVAPDLAAAAEKLGVTEQELTAALGDTTQGPGDLAAAAQTLGVTEQELMDALGGQGGAPQDGEPPGAPPSSSAPAGAPPQ